jgi:hypothetical protein
MKATGTNGSICSGCFRCHLVVLSGRSNRGYPYSRRALKELASSDAIVPEIWAFEIATSICVSYRKRKRIAEQQIHEYLGLLKALPIRIERQGLRANVDLESLARRRDIAAYDAA